MGDRRAVILGGGGITGIAWETGILLGLSDEGVDLGTADAIIGTSAGSFVGASLAGGLVAGYFEHQFDDDVPEIRAVMSAATIDAWRKAIAEGDGNPEAVGRALGRLALATPTLSPADRAKVVASRLLSSEWPEGPLKLTAINADTGVLHLFDKDSGVPITSAAAASGALPGVNPPIQAQGQVWIDGGSYSAANIHLGASYNKVVVIAPVADGWPGHPGPRDEFAALQASGTQGILIVPDKYSKEAIGPNLFDPGRRPCAAEAGRKQGRHIATEVSTLWENA
jgi:NTE family protein